MRFECSRSLRASPRPLSSFWRSEFGATTAIFSVVSAALLRPLPYPDPNRIVVVTTAGPASLVKFNFLRAQNTTLQDIAACRFGRVNLAGVEYPE